MNAPAGRKHLDDLATIPAKERAKKAEEKARAPEVKRAEGSPGGAGDWEKPCGGAKGLKLDELQLRLPLNDRGKK
ncbi:hypothetical protein ACW9YV_14765 (plasmid) [Paraburkholderia strydomiana]